MRLSYINRVVWSSVCPSRRPEKTAKEVADELHFHWPPLLRRKCVFSGVPLAATGAKNVQIVVLQYKICFAEEKPNMRPDSVCNFVG